MRIVCCTNCVRSQAHLASKVAPGACVSACVRAWGGGEVAQGEKGEGGGEGYRTDLSIKGGA